MHDYNPLRGKIKEKLRTLYAFADKIGISTVSLNKRLNDEIPFSQVEIELATKALELTNDEVIRLFLRRNYRKLYNQPNKEKGGNHVSRGAL